MNSRSADCLFGEIGYWRPSPTHKGETDFVMISGRIEAGGYTRSQLIEHGGLVMETEAADRLRRTKGLDRIHARVACDSYIEGARPAKRPGTFK